MTKKQIFQQASDFSDQRGLSANDKCSFLIWVMDSQMYQDAPYNL